MAVEHAVDPSFVYFYFLCIRLGNRICSKIEYEQQNDPWNVERFLEDLLLVVKGQSNLDIDGYL